MIWSRLSCILGALVVLGALTPLRADFLNNSYGETTVLVDFDQHSVQTELDSTPIQAYTDGAGFEISMYRPGDVATTGQVLYGFDYAFFTDGIVSVAESQAPGTQQPIVEFALSGGAVSAIGLRLSAFPGQDHSAVTLEIFDSNGVSIDSYTFGSVVAGGNSPLNPTGAGGFFGFDLGTGNSNIARFRITGATIMMDDLRYGGLAASSTGGGDTGGGDTGGGDPEPIPEPATFMLCGLALGALSVFARRGTRREA